MLSKEQLTALGADKLAEFLMRASQDFPDLTPQVEALLLDGDPLQRVLSVSEQLESLCKDDEFITYQESAAFCTHLEDLLESIAELLPDMAQEAFELVDSFLNQTQQLIERVDDVSGAMQHIVSQACLLWLDCASLLQDNGEDWVDTIFKTVESLPVNSVDALLANAERVLDVVELEQLAWRYEKSLRREINTGVGEQITGLKARHNLRLVAVALCDGKLFERTFLIGRTKLTEFDVIQVVEQYLKLDEPLCALTWLEPALSDAQSEMNDAEEEDTALDATEDKLNVAELNPVDRWRLLDQSYAQLDDFDGMLRVRKSMFTASPTLENFERLAELYEAHQRQSLIESVVDDCVQYDDLPMAVLLLLGLGATERAKELLIRRRDEITLSIYVNPAELIDQFALHGCLVSQVVCYRAMFEDLLTQRSERMFEKGTRVLKCMTVLSAQIDDFSPIETHKEYMQQVRLKFGSMPMLETSA